MLLEIMLEHVQVHLFFGDAASFHEWEFRTLLLIAGKSGKSVSKVCDGLRGCIRRGDRSWLR